MDYSEIELKLVKFLGDELAKTPASNFVVGISGGLDSAVVSALCSRVAGARTYGIIMPTRTASKQSIDDATLHCARFGIEQSVITISAIGDAFADAVETFDKKRLGNIYARARMTVLYDQSVVRDALVVGTSNLSERILGYGTIFGDMACALNPIGNILKSDLYGLARHLGVQDTILTKAPSAELYPGQTDADELGYDYATLDAVIAQAIKNGMNFDAIEPRDVAKMVQKRYEANKFKLHMPVIAEI